MDGDAVRQDRGGSDVTIGFELQEPVPTRGFGVRVRLTARPAPVNPETGVGTSDVGG